MKNPIIQRLWIAMAMLCASISAFAYDFELPAGNGMQKLQYSILSSVDQTVAVVGGTTGIIPCSVTYNNKNYTVTEIGRFAFNDVSITDYRLPLSLKAIRENAFGFSKASTIAIPDGVEIIESDAFWYSSVETIIIGSGVKNIGAGAFYGCSNLKTLVLRPQKAPTHVSRNYSIGNSSTTVIVPQLYEYEGSEIAKVVAGTMIEPIYFKQNQFIYSGKIPELDYVLKINSASTQADMTLKNKDAGVYKQSFYIWLDQIIPSYRFSDYDGYAVFPNRGVDVLYEYSITKKPLSVKIENHQRIYGEPNPSLFPYSIDGFVDGEDENLLLSPVICETTASIQSPVGSYPITCNPSALNYSFEIQQGTLNIQKAPIDIAIQNSSRVYGDGNPNYQYTFIGLRCGDTSPEITTSLQFTNIDNSVDCGEYSISVLAGELRNYYINKVFSGTLSVTPAQLVLKVSDAQKVYGDNNPDFSYILDGLRNHDDNTCLNSEPTFSCDATVESDCGEYEITASGAISKNYTISYESGILKVLPALLTLSAKDIQREYGEVNPALEYDVKGLKGNDTKLSALQEQPALAVSCNINSEVGTYPITITGGKSKNYALSYLSGMLTITQAPLTLTVVDLIRMYGSTNPKFEFSFNGLKFGETPGTVFSQLPIATTTATVKSDVGIYPVTATGGSAKNYKITEYNQGNLTITKAPLTLRANDAERLYYHDNPDFTFSLDGLVNDDDNSCISNAPVYECPATIVSDCGDYPIIPSGAESKNYEITYQRGELTINPETLILVASNVTKEYGNLNPVLKYNAIGLKGDDDLLSSLIDEPVLTTTASKKSDVGEYPISIVGGSAKNYKLNYRNGTLNITKAPLTVIAEDAERPYGDNNPTFSRSFLGFKLTDSESTAFSSLPRITCSATKTSDVGEYSIVVEGGTSRNYEVTHYQCGTLRITKASLVLTANNKSRLYHEVNPQFDFTLSGLKNNDTKSALTTTPTYNCAAELTSDAGQYTIIPSGAESKNYKLEYHNGTLTVNQRPLTVSVGDYTRKYNTDNPNFKIIYTGFVNNEDATVLTHEATIFCPATKTSDVGTYPITPQGGEATNYAITQYINGTLIIEKANQTLTWEQDLSEIEQYSQIALTANSSAGLPVSYEMSPNNVATLYNNNGTWYLDCFGSGAVNIRAVQNGDKNHNAASILTKTLIVMGIGGDPSNPQIFLNVENAGSLPDLIAENRKYQIKNLRLTGYLNGTDINFLREMAGCDSYGNSTPGVLETLDISGCTIVSGGRSYYKSCQTSNNKVSDYMFYNCKQLVNLMLPENTTEIEDYAFADCNRLSVISIPDGVKSFGVQSFRNDISLLRIPMPSGLISIKDYAFIGCNGVSEITIPASVTTIGDGIVKDCQNISKINVVEGNSHFTSENGVLYTSTFDRLLIFPVNYESNSYVVKAGTKTIAPYAFVNSKKLSDVTLPSTMTNIGEDAFIGCVNLSSLQVQALNPPVCYNDCFEAVSKTRCELIVPKGCYSYYWVAPVWSDFNKIKEADFSDVVNTPINNIAVVVENHCIVVKGLSDNDVVNIFQIDGTLVHHTQSTGNILRYNPAIPGTYLVVAANKTYKLLVR